MADHVGRSPRRARSTRLVLVSGLAGLTAVGLAIRSEVRPAVEAFTAKCGSLSTCAPWNARKPIASKVTHAPLTEAISLWQRLTPQ